ncbi:MAG: hypothetical protein RLZZ50_1966 [Verrucomicrobiota bacterium]
MVQSLTPFRHAGRGEDSPLDGVNDLVPVRAEAERLGFGARFAHDAIDLVGDLFAGRVWSYQPIDVRYHDLAHTAQASRCYLAHVEGYLRSERLEVVPRQLELGLAAILFHDTGFLKMRGDDAGTGAKYTHSHVLRSSALAASLLPTLGLARPEVEDTVGMIRCTGLGGRPDKSTFGSELSRLAAGMVATSDFLGQMAAPDYLEKLPLLYLEFEEADDFSHVPKNDRMFASTQALVAGTAGFWNHFVRPKLETEFFGVYRHLASDTPPHRNPYLDAVERNVARTAAALARG